jgi:hypothetical protein
MAIRGPLRIGLGGYQYAAHHGRVRSVQERDSEQIVTETPQHAREAVPIELERVRPTDVCAPVADG